MSDPRDTQRKTVRSWREDGRFYVISGTASAIISLVLAPVFGIVAAYSGYKIYDVEQHTVLAVLVAGTGGFGFLFWNLYPAVL